MRRVAVFAAMALLVIWMPATSFCLVENAGIVASNGCCDDSRPAGSSPCCELASASYKTDQNYRVAAIPLLAQFVTPICLPHYDVESSNIGQIHADVSPPELRHTWQFCIRAAPRPRAPSSAS